MKRSSPLSRLVLVPGIILLALATMYVQLALLGEQSAPGASLLGRGVKVVQGALAQLFGVLGKLPSLIVVALGLQESTVRAMQETGMQVALCAVLLGFILLLVIHRRSKRVYAALSLAVIISMVGSPLLQAQQVYAAYERQAAPWMPPPPHGPVTPPKTLAEIDAAFNRALQTYINLPTDIDPAERQQMEEVLISVIEGYAAQRQDRKSVV